MDSNRKPQLNCGPLGTASWHRLGPESNQLRAYLEMSVELWAVPQPQRVLEPGLVKDRAFRGGSQIKVEIARQKQLVVRIALTGIVQQFR